MFLRYLHVLFYKLILLISIEFKMVPQADEPKNRQRVVRMNILSSREEIILVLSTEQDQTGLITEYKLKAKKLILCA